MVINIRYYVIMSASIFLALGVGIFIGFSLDGQEIFVEQQQGLISELEQRFLDLKQQNTMIETMLEDSKKELKVYGELLDWLIPQLVEGVLEGLNIAIIQNGGETDFGGMVSMLNHAGAQVTSTVRINKDFFCDNRHGLMLLRENLDEFVEEGQLRPYMYRRLVNAIITGGDQDFVRRLKELGVIEVSEGYSGEVDYFILAGEGFAAGPGTEAEPGVFIIEAIKRSNIPAVGVEKSDCGKSSIPHYRDARISSVDNVDSVIGQYSLIRVLQGCTGHYGLKDTAQALIPPWPDEM
jgi:hypothetical protein